MMVVIQQGLDLSPFLVAMVMDRPDQGRIQNFFIGGAIWGPLKILGWNTKNRTVHGCCRRVGVTMGIVRGIQKAPGSDRSLCGLWCVQTMLVRVGSRWQRA